MYVCVYIYIYIILGLHAAAQRLAAPGRPGLRTTIIMFIIIIIMMRMVVIQYIKLQH